MGQGNAPVSECYYHHNNNSTAGIAPLLSPLIKKHCLTPLLRADNTLLDRTYTYDAWGNFATSYHNGYTATGPANLNPFRYRGYYYDVDLQMYYLQSRYYDPVIGRFVSPDKFATTGQGVLGANMFAYCLNDPINRVDTEGHASIWPTLWNESDYGYIHRLVQKDIANRSGGAICTEVTFLNRERADLVNRYTGEVWEIKHGGKDPLGRIVEAQVQVSKYLYRQGICKGERIPTAGYGAPYRFTGCFTIAYGNGLCLVTYVTPAPGTVLYFVEEIGNKNAYAYAPAYAYKKKEKSVAEFALNWGWAISVSIVGGCGSGGIAGGYDRLFRVLIAEE